ncbi:POK19 protein, partial [Fregata magnificens]|nr:POK19 protein [Fregata magnificens]
HHKGNHIADLHTAIAVVLQSLQQAKLSHKFIHQNRKALQKQFQLTAEQARQIILACPECQALAPMPSQLGVNPRGSKALELWQTDVTHLTEFGCLKYVHVNVDTFSHYLVATAH